MSVLDSKIPTLVIYWADVLPRAPLTFEERQSLYRSAVLVSITPREVLIEVTDGKHKGRKVAVCGVSDPRAPVVPMPRRR